jgi:chromosome segregation ATPase
MGRPLLQLEPLRGVTDLSGFLEVITDPKKYRAIIKELEDLRKSLNQRIEAVGKITQIERIRGEAARDREQAARELAKARQTIETEAQAWAEEYTNERKKLDDRSKSISARDRKGKDTLDRREKELEAREGSAETMMKEAIAVKEMAEGASEIARRLQEEYDGKLAVINDTLSKVTH